MLIAKPGRKGCQDAVTRWRILSRQNDHAVFELKPETGRTHQIRAHLMGVGCPILGDHLYGSGARSADRLMLHARSLEIALPDQGRQTFRAPVPTAFAEWAAQLGLQLPE